jgi:hypothetical protein
MGAIAVYLLAADMYSNVPMVPLLDLIASGVLTLFWFLGWCSWVAQSGNIKHFQSTLEDLCKDTTVCHDRNRASFASITVSLVFGFLNILLWAASLWFVYKETHFHRKPEDGLPGPGPTGDRPQQVSGPR